MQVPNWLFNTVVEYTHAEVLAVCSWILFIASKLWDVPSSDDSFVSCRKDKLRNIPRNISGL